MSRVLLWLMFFNGFLFFFAWWGVWPMMLLGAFISVAAHVMLTLEETR